MEGVMTLSLLALTCQSAAPGHIQVISRLCPRVKSLVLYAPFDVIPDCDVETKTLDALSNSAIAITTLDLRNFRVSGALWNLLRVKGYHIKSLGLKLRSVISTQEMEYVATSCPNLTSLHFYAQYVVDSKGYQYNSSKPLFRRLERLCLGVARRGMPVASSFMEMCLSFALDIQQFILFYLETDTSEVNAMWERIMRRNPMRLLENLHISNVTPLSWQTVSRILTSCPLLVKLTIPPSDSASDQEHFLKLKEEIIAKNLDLEYNTANVYS